MAAQPTSRKPINMTAGQRYGRLVAVAFESFNGHKKAMWTFRCDCGETYIALVGNVARGATQSCGCLNREVLHARRGEIRTHGKSYSPEYFSWKSMIARCNNPKATGYDRYGGRGITVCDQWMTFEGFYADMGERPPGTTLDRENNDGNYEPGNVRWATNAEQKNNQRTNRTVLFQGREMTLAQACRLAGLNYHAVHRRINHSGWSVDRALTTPI